MPHLVKKLNEILIEFKKKYEDAIKSKTAINLIRSQTLINMLHEFTKLELIDRNIESSRIYPPLNNSKPEKRIIGFLKGKNQDVTVFPSYTKSSEYIKKGAAIGKKDPYGSDYLAKTLTVNVRSQLSSVRKNFDTLYERSFAEPLNLHLRVPSMVLGELYLIPTMAYNSDGIKNGKIILRENNYLLKYISSYIALNKRTIITSDYHKYEKMCLLVVDFSQDLPQIVNTFTDLKNYLTSEEKNILSNFTQDELNDLEKKFKDLTIANFVDDLLDIYDKRHNLKYLLKQQKTLY